MKQMTVTYAPPAPPAQEFTFNIEDKHCPLLENALKDLVQFLSNYSEPLRVGEEITIANRPYYVTISRGEHNYALYIGNQDKDKIMFLTSRATYKEIYYIVGRFIWALHTEDTK